MTVNGWVNLYKPKGMSSAKALVYLKKILGRKAKIGHAGTLDPLAEGVLPVALGEATKSVPYIQADEKVYAFEVTWGEARTTDDAEGEVIETSSQRPTDVQLKGVLPQFIGKISQIPPIYSALKVDGRRAYDLARAGKDVALKAREIQVHDLELISSTQDTAKFRVRCGKGTYVRSLARDIATACETVGYVSELIREQVGRFHAQEAVAVENLVDLAPQDLLQDYVKSIVEVLDDIPALNVDASVEENIRCGLRPKVSDFQSVPTSEFFRITSANTGQLIAIAEIAEGEIKTRRVFNL